jgi:23S rRNA pseudouridine2605 synthase
MKTSRAPGRVSLPRALSKLGIASRSQAVRLIEQGAVAVNGKAESNTHRWIDLNRDRIVLKDQVLQKRAFRYLVLNKPPGFVTTRSDERGQRTVFDLLGAQGEGISPVGRLDKETGGLLLFTNDHQLANLLTSPESNFRKTYIADLDRPIREKDLLLLAGGLDIEIEGRAHRTKPAEVSQVHAGRVEISITEGKNRQIRRMMDSLGYEVVTLRRIAVGPLKLGDLPEGGSRELSGEEVQELRRAVHPHRPEGKKRGVDRRYKKRL